MKSKRVRTGKGRVSESAHLSGHGGRESGPRLRTQDTSIVTDTQLDKYTKVLQQIRTSANTQIRRELQLLTSSCDSWDVNIVKSMPGFGLAQHWSVRDHTVHTGIGARLTLRALG